MFLHPLPITEQGHIMITPTHSELVTVDRADIERIHHALMDLWDSASTEGCEEPYGVIDMTHLNTLQDRQPQPGGRGFGRGGRWVCRCR